MSDFYQRWWLVTWTTYGTWLPGDPRGFQTWRGREYIPPPKRYAKAGEPIYGPHVYTNRYESAREAMVEDPVHLSEPEQSIVVDAMVAECDEIPFTPSILAVGEVHIHLLARIGSYSLRTVAGRLKAAATKRLHQEGFSQENAWCQGCHLNSKDTPPAIRSAFDYVRRHEDEGATIYVWRDPFKD